MSWASRIAPIQPLACDSVMAAGIRRPDVAVALFDTATPLAPLREEIRDAITRVVDSGAFVLGPEVSTFERELAAYVGAGEAIGVANGTDAITLALRAMGVGPGDEVVVPAFTFYASAEAIPPTGARPVFCDVDPETYCVTADTVRAALSARTKAVIAVHLFGNLAPVSEIAQLGVPVLEDAAQALGSRGPEGRPGSLGTAATFSFFPSKNLGAFGDGGAVTTSDPDIAERVRRLRFHGSRDKQTFEEVGYNSRLDAIQAAVLRVQLPHLDRWSDGRRAAAAAYEAAGLGELVSLPRVAGGEPAWHLYVVRTPAPDALAEALQAQGIGARSYYRVPTHEQPGMHEFAPAQPLPGTDQAARTNLALPMSPVLSAEQVDEVIGAARGHLAAVAL
ncbi:MAG: DegT/DnrJ/EryC1/StrS family aminotransferase [Actinomycetota bacterium]|nr:DegT/DnrJ/EryC1/StrS family aminotransferase [Actinomycetota bacterium]